MFTNRELALNLLFYGKVPNTMLTPGVLRSLITSESGRDVLNDYVARLILNVSKKKFKITDFKKPTLIALHKFLSEEIKIFLEVRKIKFEHDLNVAILLCDSEKEANARSKQAKAIKDNFHTAGSKKVVSFLSVLEEHCGIKEKETTATEKKKGGLRKASAPN
jgi:hypothetical protein